MFLSGDYSCLRVQLLFARQLSFFLVTVYVPCSMTVSVSWMSFWLDHKAVRIYQISSCQIQNFEHWLWCEQSPKSTSQQICGVLLGATWTSSHDVEYEIRGSFHPPPHSHLTKLSSIPSNFCICTKSKFYSPVDFYLYEVPPCIALGVITPGPKFN